MGCSCFDSAEVNRTVAKSNPLRLRVADPLVDRGAVIVRGADLHHIRVRRLRPADRVVCFDDAGFECEGTIQRITADCAEIVLAFAAQPPRESPLHLSLAQAVLKGDHLAFVVEKAVELGVSEVVLMQCERAIARPSVARVERLRRIAESAAKQSGRVRVPDISGPVAFAEVLSPSAILFQPGAERNWNETTKETTQVTAIVGPEGGFVDDEVERARDAGCRIVALGPRILRAETAAVVACAFCQRIWGDL